MPLVCLRAVLMDGGVLVVGPRTGMRSDSDTAMKTSTVVAVTRVSTSHCVSWCGTLYQCLSTSTW